jgi:hypothetical protein
MSEAAPGHPRNAHAVIALTSAAVLLFEVAITRLLSVVLWYHFAFLSVSLAMLGVGAPGVWMALRRPRPRSLSLALAAAAAALPLSIVIITQVAAPMAVGARGGAQLPKVVVIVLCVGLPLLCLGYAICFLLVGAKKEGIARMYGADLLGGAVGAVITVPLLGLVPTPALLAGIGLLPLLALAMLEPKARVWSGLAALVLVGSLFWEAPYRLVHNKVYDEKRFTVVHEEWTPTARLTVVESNPYAKQKGAWGWGFGTRFEGTDLDEMWLEQDGSAGTPITAFNGDLSQLSFLDFDVTGVGYTLRSPKRACVIGAGGGRDILTALRAGAQHVDAVELHPETIDIVSEVLGEFSGDPYHQPGVVPHASEGRSFLTRSQEPYDLIQISLIDSWAATAAGAYSLSENYLYTLEALGLYLERLTNNGVLSITRWVHGPDQLEIGRLVLLAEAALQKGGLNRDNHMLVIQGGSVATLLLSRAPFSADELKAVDENAELRGFVRHWPKPDPIPEGSLVLHVLLDGPEQLASAGFDLSPPTDDRPFFFQRTRPFTPIDDSIRNRLSFNDEAPLLARTLTLVVGALTLLLFFAPFFWIRGPRAAGLVRGSLFFTFIGLGFMLVEAPLIQRLILILGHPSYATTVVLSTLLMASGLGSLFSGRKPATGWLPWRLMVPLVVLLAAIAGPFALHWVIGLPLAIRILACVLLLLPLGFVLGFPFPVGLRHFGDGDMPWFWALNGAAGVLATVSSVPIASYLGFSGTIALGIAAYVLAALTLGKAGGSSGL